MMKAAVCTISTYSHLFKVEALRRSVQAHAPEAAFYVLLVDSQPSSAKHPLNLKKAQLLHLSDLDLEVQGNAIRETYANSPDRLRWCMKPVLMQYLLTKGKAEELIYVDNDICFFHDFAFIFEELQNKGMLLTPHWRDFDPKKDAHNFEANFRDGLYNGGFVGASSKGLPALEWWTSACLHGCVKDYQRGLYDDQRYLDLIPVIYPEAGILRHRGCNVAVWNQNENQRSLTPDGKLMINQSFPLIFIHLTNDLFREMYEFGKDSLLIPAVEEYLDLLWDINPLFEIKKVRLPYPEGHPSYKEGMIDRNKRKLDKKRLEYRWAAQWYGRKLRHFVKTGKLKLPD